MPASGHYVTETDIDSWESGADKQAAINFCEQLLEKILGRPFYSAAFDIEQNGPGKNRITLRLRAPILTVTAVYLCGIELDSTWYDWDESSVFLELCGSGVAVGDPELYYRLSQSEEQGLFPKGLNNIRIVGTFGSATVPQPIKQCVIYLVDAYNEGFFETSSVAGFKSEKIGDYSYTLGVDGYSKNGIYTGIPKADAIIRHYKKQRKPVMGAV